MIVLRSSQSTLSDNPISPQGSPLPFYSILVPIIVAVAIAFGVSHFVERIPAKDHIEDFGPSLLAGYENYSEKAEQRSFLAFVATSIAVAGLVTWSLSRAPHQLCLRLGNLAVWIPLLALLGFWQSFLVPQLLLVMGLTFIAIQTVAQAVGRFRCASPAIAWVIPVFIWGVLHDRGLYLLLGLNAQVAAAVTVIVAMLIVLSWRFPSKMELHFGLITAVTYCVLLWVIVSKSRLTGACIYVLSSLLFLEASRQDRRTVWRAFFRRGLDHWELFRSRRWWICFAASVLWIQIGYQLRSARLDVWDLTLLSLQGAAAGFLLFRGAHRVSINPFRALGIDRLRRLTDPRALPVVAFLASSIRGIDGLWFGVCVAVACTWLIQTGRPRPRPATVTGILLAVLLAAACIPDFDRKGGFDTFHDGQILPAVWEFEQGETLYDRVLPLRSAKFFLAWLSRKVFSATYDGSIVIENFSNSACAAGACLAAFAWTRSALWSIVIGLLVQPGGELNPTIADARSPLWLTVAGLQLPSYGDVREGILLMIAGLTCEILRRGQYKSILLLLLSLPTFYGGYDVMVPYLAAVAAATFCGEFKRDALISWVVQGTFKSAILVGTSVLSFTTILVLTQGFGSAIAFWQVFFDYMRHLNSFFGTPLTASRLVNLELIGLSTFAVTGVVCWNKYSRRRRQMWSFLLVISCLFWFRALGRSDYGHITGPLHLFHLLWALWVFDAVRLIARTKLGFHTSDPQTVGAVLLVCVVAGAGGTSNPWRLFNQLHQIAGHPRDSLQADPNLAAILGPQDYLWAADYGLLNYGQKKHNPTRHAQAFCISSPNEQRVAVADLKARPPAVVVWYFISVDDIDGPTRQYILANQVLKQYRPAGKLSNAQSYPYLVPIEADSVGREPGSYSYDRERTLRRLPQVWGALRWPKLQSRIVSEQSIGDWTPSAPTADETEFHVQWQSKTGIEPREINYLLFEFSILRNPRITIDPKQSATWPTVKFDFAAKDNAITSPQTTWECPPDGKIYAYLVPIGCQPGWVWSSVIDQMRISTGPEFLMSAPVVRAINIDELCRD